MKDRKKTRIQLVLDFDGTITTEDTTATIGGKCLEKAIELAPAGLSEDELPKPMSYYSDKYMQDYRAWKESQTEPRAKRQTVADEISYLSQSRQVEIDSFLRVRQAVLSVPGCTRDFEHNDSLRNQFMMDAGREAVRSGEVKIRDYDALTSLIKSADDGDNEWGIVSVSWSRWFILGVLVESGLLDEGRVDEKASDIKCNELLSPFSGDIICSAADKAQSLAKILTHWTSERLENDDPMRERAKQAAPITIYVGDSSTDIGCLTHASIGLYICRDSSTDSVVQMLTRVGIEVQPLQDQSPPENKTVYTIKGFDEALEWFNGNIE